MADSTPLLSKSDGSDKPSSQPISLDETIELCVEGFGLVQFIQVMLIAFAWVFDCQHTFISIFSDAEPKWHCTDFGIESQQCTSAADVCHLPEHVWAWNEPKHTTIISDWGLQCASSVIKGLPASSFFMGCVLGGLFLATLADTSLGRKNLLFLSCLLISFSSLFIVFTENIWIYSLLKFVNGVGRATVGSTSLVLSMELVGKHWRGQAGAICAGFSLLGFLTLPAIAYLNRGASWRTLYLWISVPTIFYSLLVFFFVCESPRWLFLRGRHEEAISTLKTIASSKSGDLITTLSSNIVTVKQEATNIDAFSAFNILFQRKWAIRRLTNLLLVLFGIGMLYYGMPLSLGNLSFNLYLSVTLNALSEIPSSLFTSLLVDRFDRKGLLLFFNMLSGICSILCVVTFTHIKIGLELVSFFSACTAFTIAQIYAIELFPTCVRTSVLCLSRISTVLGAVLSPVLVAAARKNGFVFYGISGLLIGICGLFVLLLPETKGKKLCATMNEEEEYSTDRTARSGTYCA